jgi:hypothetical protein
MVIRMASPSTPGVFWIYVVHTAAVEMASLSTPGVGWLIVTGEASPPGHDLAMLPCSLSDIFRATASSI